MRIIALQGKHNSGKTTTLKKLIESIHLSADGFVFEDVNPKRDVLELCRKEEGDMQYWCTYNGIKIGITTRGDAERYLEADFFTRRKNFSDRNIVVCAIRSHGETEGFVKRHADDGYVIHGRWFVDATEGETEKRSGAQTSQVNAILQDIKGLIEK